MYYEIFEEIKHAHENNTSLSNLQLFNKCIIDSFFELRSEISPIYSEENDFKRLVENNYSYLFYQKMISGISKGVFLGINPMSWGNSDIFLPSLRMSVPQSELQLNASSPVLYFNKGNFSFENSSLKKWEDETMKISSLINKKLNLSITQEGFRSNLNRILEVMFSMRSASKKRRTDWTIFLHELIILQKTFTKEELLALNFTVSEQTDGFSVSDSNFQDQDYLEYKFLKDLSQKSQCITDEIVLEGSPIERYSQFNQKVIGKIPLCHFYINEHMFIGKEEYLLDQYINYYIYPWTKAKAIFVTYLQNETGKMKTSSIDSFKEELKTMKYSLVLGFHEARSHHDTYFYAEPRMVKD